MWQLLNPSSLTREAWRPRLEKPMHRSEDQMQSKVTKRFKRNIHSGVVCILKILLRWPYPKDSHTHPHSMYTVSYLSLVKQFLDFLCAMGHFGQLVKPFQSHVFNAQQDETHTITIKTNWLKCNYKKFDILLCILLY